MLKLIFFAGYWLRGVSVVLLLLCGPFSVVALFLAAWLAMLWRVVVGSGKLAARAGSFFLCGRKERVSLWKSK